MKRLLLSTSLFLAAATFGVTAHAQTTGSKSDPVKVDAKHYKTEFENEHVRVLRITYGPGEKSVMHSHPNAVAVFLTDGTARMTTPDGKSEMMPIKAGTANFTAAGAHLPENTGQKRFELILVELKK